MEDRRKRVGRPPLPVGERRSEFIGFRVSPSEADALYQAAVRRGEDLSELLRECGRRILGDDVRSLIP
jgi:hypothetical protein